MTQGRLLSARGRRALAPVAVLCGLGALGFFMGQGAAAMHDMQARLAQEAAQGVAPRQVIIHVVGAQGTPTPAASKASHTTTHAVAAPTSERHSGHKHSDTGGSLITGDVRPLSGSSDPTTSHGKGAHGPKD